MKNIKSSFYTIALLSLIGIGTAHAQSCTPIEQTAEEIAAQAIADAKNLAKGLFHLIGIPPIPSQVYPVTTVC